MGGLKNIVEQSQFLLDVMLLCVDKKRLYAAPPKPATIMEALEQRLEKYKATAEQAKLEGESSKLRRMTRMVKVRYHFHNLQLLLSL